MGTYSLILEALPEVNKRGFISQLVSHRPTSASGLGNLSVLIWIRPLRVDFSEGGPDRHIGAVDCFSPSMASAWNTALILAKHIKADCEESVKVYDLRPDVDKSGLNIASLKISALLYSA